MHTIHRRQAPPAISPARNGVERVAQIKSIQARVERIRRAHQQVGADLNQLRDDVGTLAEAAPGIPPVIKEHS